MIKKIICTLSILTAVPLTAAPASSGPLVLTGTVPEDFALYNLQVADLSGVDLRDANNLTLVTGTLDSNSTAGFLLYVQFDKGGMYEAWDGNQSLRFKTVTLAPQKGTTVGLGHGARFTKQVFSGLPNGSTGFSVSEDSGPQTSGTKGFNFEVIGSWDANPGLLNGTYKETITITVMPPASF
jgi:hypothetical protein